MSQALFDLMKKKGKQEVNPMQHSARGNMLDALKSAMDGEMGADVHGLKKVTVAAPDASGLEHGLDKAKGMLAGADDESAEDPKEEASETPSEEDSEDVLDDVKSPEECDMLIKQLEMKKLMFQKGKNI